MAKQIAVVGAGWAGLAAAVRAVEAGHSVTVLEASQSLGGRARAVSVRLPNGEQILLDNGQHVLLGAYRETLALMQVVGVDVGAVVDVHPVRLAMLQTKTWRILDYASLAATLMLFGLRSIYCPQGLSVLGLSALASHRVYVDVIESLCLSALNTAPAEASGRVFLRVLKDAFASRQNSKMLIPTVDLGSLFPDRARTWLQSKGSEIKLGERVTDLAALQSEFDHIIVATPPWEAARLLRGIAPEWADEVDALEYRAIATVYAQAPPNFCLPTPIKALASDAQNPAQFVFARREARGLLAFVVSDAKDDRAALERLVLAQGEAILGVALQSVATIVEKRATFACTPQLKRPSKLTLEGLSVVGDYLEGPYPSTIEGAVLSAPSF